MDLSPAGQSPYVVMVPWRLDHLKALIVSLSGGEGKFKEMAGEALFPCLFVRNPPKSLAKITRAAKLSQYS